MTAVVRTFVALVAMATMVVLPARSAAQSADDLAKATQNPIANLISVPLQANWDFGIGDRDATGTVFNIQPVMPFSITPRTNVVLRVIMPLLSQPGAGADSPRANGMGDTLATAFLSPSNAGTLIWGVGPAVSVPTATNAALGSEKFAIGPSVVVLAQPGKWTIGALANHLWSTSGANDRADVNATFVQPFVNYNLGNGAAAGVSMEASGNWEADETWTAPLLFTLTKVTRLGTQPVNLGVGAGPMLASPEAGANWRFRLVAVFLFPTRP